MKKIRGLFLGILFGGVCLFGEQTLAVSVRDESVVSEYNFHGNFTDERKGSDVTIFGTNGNPSTVRYNDEQGYGSDEHGDYWYWKTDSPRGGGFYIDLKDVLQEGHSIGLRFSMEDTGLDLSTAPNGYKKIIDYNNTLTDTGFYFRYGKLMYYNIGNKITSSNVIQPNQVVDLVAVREENSDFSVYLVIDGKVMKEVEVENTGSQTIPAVINGKSRLGFFYDDDKARAEGTSGGKIYNLKVWNVALKQEEIGESLNEYPKTPILDKLQPEDTKISGTTTPDVSVTLTLPNGSQLTTNSDSDGAFSFTVPSVKEGDTYTVKAKNKYGFESDEASVVAKYVLGLNANNIEIPLADIVNGKLDESTHSIKDIEKEIKTLAQTKTENLITGDVDEDSSVGQFSDNVTISANQLKELQQAKDTKVAKPYPLDLTYKTSEGQRNKRIWVFVSDKNTAVDQANNLVMYANDYGLLTKETTQEDKDKVFTHSAVKVYPFNEQKDELTVLADSSKSTSLSVNPIELAKITSALKSGDYPLTLTYNDGKSLSVQINVSVSDSTVPLKIEYKDEDGELVDSQTIDVTFGSTINLTQNSDVTDRLSNIKKKGYSIEEPPSNEKNLLVDASNMTVVYTLKGQLIFKEVPTEISFEDGEVTSKQQKLSYNGKDSLTLSFIDNRKKENRGNFELQSQLSDDFRNSSGAILNGATLSYSGENPSFDITKSKGKIIQFSNPSKDTKRDYQFVAADSNNELTLIAPMSSIREPGEYKTKIVWTLIGDY